MTSHIRSRVEYLTPTLCFIYVLAIYWQAFMRSIDDSVWGLSFLGHPVCSTVSKWISQLCMDMLVSMCLLYALLSVNSWTVEALLCDWHVGIDLCWRHTGLKTGAVFFRSRKSKPTFRTRVVRKQRRRFHRIFFSTSRIFPYEKHVVRFERLPDLEIRAH